MAWEAGRLRSTRRMHLAQLVLRHRALPRDPLSADVADPAPELLDPGAGATDVAAVDLF